MRSRIDFFSSLPPLGNASPRSSAWHPRAMTSIGGRQRHRKQSFPGRAFPSGAWEREDLSNDSLQLWVFQSIRLAIKFRRNERLRRHVFAPGIADKCLDDLDPHAIGELNGVSVDLALLDRLLAFG